MAQKNPTKIPRLFKPMSPKAISLYVSQKLKQAGSDVSQKLKQTGSDVSKKLKRAGSDGKDFFQDLQVSFLNFLDGESPLSLAVKNGDYQASDHAVKS